MQDGTKRGFYWTYEVENYQRVTEKQCTLLIAKSIGRDHRTVRKFAINQDSCSGRKIAEGIACVSSNCQSDWEIISSQPHLNQKYGSI